MVLEQPIFYTATSVCISGLFSPETWSCFKNWTAVDTLFLSRFSKHALAGFVAAVNRQDFRLFPALRHLHIVDATVVESEESRARPDSEAYDPVEGEGLRGTDAQEFLAAMKRLAKYEGFECLTLTRCAVSTAALQATKGALGNHRVEGDVESPAERFKWREDRKNTKIDWDKPKSWQLGPLPNTD